MRSVSFGVLGPLEVRIDGREIAPPGKIARRMLAVLLLSADQPIGDDQLGGWTWGARRVSRGALHTAVYRLRSWLTDEAGPAVALVHGVGGYQLQFAAEDVDAVRFRALAGRASDRADGVGRVGDLEEALALWRGRVISDLPEWTREHPEVAALERERVAALGSLADAAVTTGQQLSESAFQRIEQLAAELPYDETVQARWLRLLAAYGRRADAMRHYENVRRRLADDLGVDPSAVLRDAHLTLLGDDEPAAAGPRSAPSAPRMLPRGVADFSGRTGEVERLVEFATAEGGPERVVVIDGMAGVGKTSLAVHGAHRLSSEFPDGQIFVDLQGFTEAAQPVEPGDALDRMLRSLGVSGEQIPSDVADRTALWHSLLADRRMFIVLDNAASEAQIRPLLPAAPECLVLVTSRRRLSGLDDIRPVSLDVLPPTEAAELFRGTVGPDRLAAEPDELVVEVVDLCGRLPLAVRIAAARMRDRPSWRLDDLARRLGDQAELLAELAAGDRSVAAAFRLSYEQLDESGRVLFRRLGLHAGPDIDVHAAAALVDLPVRTARRMLDGLVDMHLLEQPAADRYHFHDLLGSYAAELAGDEDPDHVRRAAVERLLDYYTSRVTAAVEIVEPGETTAGWQRPTDPSARFGGREEATAWLDVEHRNLIAAGCMAVRHGLPTYAIALSDSLHRHFTHRRHLDDALTLHGYALEAARQCDDTSGEGRALRWLAGTRGRLGDHQAAAELCEQALSRFRAAGDRIGQYDALYLSAGIKLFQGELAIGREQLEQARALDLSPGSVSANSQVRMLKLLAFYSRELGEYDAAVQYAREGVRIAADLGPRILGASWAMLGSALHDLGRHDEAIDALSNAVRCHQEAGNPGGQSLGVNNIGRSLRGLGRLDEALDRHREALAIAREIADRNAQLEANREIGATLRESGRPDAAMHHLENALALAGELDQLLDTARAHDELARTHLARGGTDQAREHWQEALAIMTDLGLPDASRVRDDLAALDQA